MTAFIYDKYGPPQTLRMAEADKPAPDAGESLVTVLAISVTAADWHSMRGKPRFSRPTLVAGPGEGGRGNGMRDFPSPAWAGVRRTGSGPCCHGPVADRS
jgi:hypothetical protein